MSLTSRIIKVIKNDESKSTGKKKLLTRKGSGKRINYASKETSTKSGLFRKRRDIFIKLIYHQAALTLEGLEALKTYVVDQDPKAAKLLKLKEKEADEARRILINVLNKTFITPFDREDIFALSRTIDDVLDYAYSTVTEMEIFKVHPTPFIQQIASLLRDAAEELLSAVDCLEEHPGVSNEHSQRAKAIENRIEEVYREALADLFKGGDNIKHVIKMMKSREVYRHLSNAGDRVDEAANVIADIVVKTT
jgi:predicted phosphate transport protein (TIGR00153 family)